MWIAKLKALKRKAKTTYREIAAACNVSWTRVSEWFNGEVMPETAYIDIMYEKFFSDVIAIDNLERYFQFAYDEQHNVNGQISMCEVNEEPKETNAVVPIKLWHPKRGYIDAYYDRSRELLYIQYISTDLAEALGMTWEKEDE